MKFRSALRNCFLAAACLLIFFDAPAQSGHSVTPEVISEALPTAAPGDVLVIADGTYRDLILQTAVVGADWFRDRLR